tara:strand:+ start:236 stop:475 length:240 start_codon:yes stop_codon:yes gene_type:complete
MTLINIKCPYCGSEGHTDDEGSEMSYGNCKDCGKEFGWNSEDVSGVALSKEVALDETGRWDKATMEESKLRRQWRNRNE